MIRATGPTTVAFSDPGGRRFVLNPGEVMVWSYSLDVSPAIRAQCRSWLSVDEADRARRFVSELTRQHYEVAHGGLRSILSQYTSQDPALLRFQSGPAGKPALQEEGDSPSAEIGFNLTHSHGRCLVAVAAGRQVGIDVELIRQDVECEKLAARFFAPAERRAVAGQERSQQAAAFFRHWVAKEAYLKLKGVGLQFPLERCQITLSADNTMAAVDWMVKPGLVEQGTVRFLPLSEGWLGAVAAEGTGWSVRVDEWPLA
ncbi:MAG: 4'-phosphopantetheinyl transferase superfamily protein [Nitrospira sp.]